MHDINSTSLIVAFALVLLYAVEVAKPLLAKAGITKDEDIEQGYKFIMRAVVLVTAFLIQRGMGIDLFEQVTGYVSDNVLLSYFLDAFLAGGTAHFGYKLSQLKEIGQQTYEVFAVDPGLEE